MEGAGDLLIEEDIHHRLEHLRVEADGELSDVARALVAVEDRVDLLGMVGGGLDDLTLAELEDNIVKDSSLVEARGVDAEGPLDGVLHRGGENLSVGNVVLPGAADCGDVLHREFQIGSRPTDMDIAGVLHPLLQRLHLLCHGRVIDRTDIEVEVLEALRAHMGLLGHPGRRPAQHNPLRARHPHLEVDGLEDVLLVELHLFLRHIGHLGGVVRSAQADVALRLLHHLALVFSDVGKLVLLGVHVELPQDPVLAGVAQRVASGFANPAQQHGGEFLGDVKGLDDDLLSRLDFTGMADDHIGELFVPGVLHAWGSFQFSYFSSGGRPVSSLL